MIQVYLPGNTDYKKNGDMTLFPISADLEVELNAAWYLSLEHPLDKTGRWKYIVDQAVIKAPSFNGDQLFRIKKKIKTDTSVRVTAEPIFMDSRDDCFLPDIRPTEKTGQQALDIMMAPNKKYSGKSDITSLHTAYYEFKNLIEAINGSDENSFINRWGGEILFNNFEVVINKRIGGDYGVQILYGKNIKKDGIKEDVDFTDVVTRIYPKAYNGYAMTGNGYVDSPLLTSYPMVKAKTITFPDVKMREDAREDDTENGIIICDTQQELDAALSKRCHEEYAAGIDKPSVQITCDIIMLQNIDAYAEYAELETVSIGDTVHLKHELLDIASDARVIKFRYDCIREKVSSVVIGDFQYDYFSSISTDIGSLEGKISDFVGPDGRIPADKVYGIIDGVKAQMRAQRTVASKQEVRAMLCEDLDPESPEYGAMCFGSMGFMIASERTADGRDWNWKTFGTGKGFFADCFVAGYMLCDRIRGGTLTLGDTGNKDGWMQVLNAVGDQIVRCGQDGIEAIAGMIGGWNIGKNGLYNDDIGASIKRGSAGFFNHPSSAVVLYAGSKRYSDMVKNAEEGNDEFPEFVVTAEGNAMLQNLSAAGDIWGKTITAGNGATKTFDVLSGLTWTIQDGWVREITKMFYKKITVSGGIITNVEDIEREPQSM